MYLRFTASFINEFQQTETGVFQALGFLRESADTKEEDLVKLNALKCWFNNYLERPNRFLIAKNKNPAPVSLSWYNDSAKVHISKMRDAIAIMEDYDILVEMVATDNPGYIIYEDDFQVSAIPFRTDKKQVL